MWLLRNILFYFTCFFVFQLTCANYLNGSMRNSKEQILLDSKTKMNRNYDVADFLSNNTNLMIGIASGLLLLIMIVKLRSKWTGIKVLGQNEKYNFIYNAPISNQFLKFTRLFYGTEALVSGVFSLLFFYFDQRAWPFCALLLFNCIEGFYFLYSNYKQQKFRLAINENAVVHNARGTYIIPFEGLKSIQYKYNDYFFIYKSGETLTLPENAVNENYRASFREKLSAAAQQKGIFFTKELKS